MVQRLWLGAEQTVDSSNERRARVVGDGDALPFTSHFEVGDEAIWVGMKVQERTRAAVEGPGRPLLSQGRERS